MKSILQVSSLPGAAALAFSLALVLPSHAQHKQPTEAQCRDMVDSMLKEMHASMKGQEKESYKKEGKAVIDRAEKIVKDNRAKGASECDSWGAIMKLVTST